MSHGASERLDFEESIKSKRNHKLKVKVKNSCFLVWVFCLSKEQAIAIRGIL
jgi:hypothetical protein